MKMLTALIGLSIATFCSATPADNLLLDRTVCDMNAANLVKGISKNLPLTILVAKSICWSDADFSKATITGDSRHWKYTLIDGVPRIGILTPTGTGYSDALELLDYQSNVPYILVIRSSESR
jgi:hypothetical protein